MSSTRLLARNSALNLLGLTVPLAVAVITIPLLIRGLGTDRFGILTLVWAAIGYFGLFEFGLGRALTQSLARQIGVVTEDDLAATSWTGLALLAALGCVGGLAVAGLTPVLVDRVLNVPVALESEARVSFYILACSLPFVLTAVGLRGIMEAHQHFGLVNVLRIPLAAFNYVGPLFAFPFSHSLVPAVAILAVGRAIGWAAHFSFCLKRYGFVRGGVAIRRSAMGPLVRFGGWATISNVVSPAMVYLDRFLIGAVLPIAAVAQYVTPYEMVSKLLVIPGAIIATMFPAFAATAATDPDRMRHLYDQSLRVIVLVMFPLTAVVVLLAPEILTVWLGHMLPHQSVVVMQWLAVGVLTNSIAQVPFAALQGAGRPDPIAKLHMIELPLYVAGIWMLIHSFGLVGVAVAWTLRVALDMAALLVMSRARLATRASTRLSAVAMLVCMFAVMLVGARLEGLTTRLAYGAVVLAVFGALSWMRLLTRAERQTLRVWLSRAPALAEGASS